MANRRMFAKTVTSSADFLLLPLEVQAMYFQIGMNADDDGYCDYLSILRMTLSDETLVYHLATSGFLLVYQNYICKIAHWEINNQIRKDRHSPSIYNNKELQPLTINWQPFGNHLATSGKPSVVKGSIGKVRKEKKQVKKESTVVSLPEWLDKKVWDEWVQFRKERKAKLTPSTIKLQLKWLEERKADHVTIIHHTIMKGWIGLREPNGKKEIEEAISPLDITNPDSPFYMGDRK